MKFKTGIILLILVCLNSAIQAQLLINEIQVTNLSTLQDEDGEYEDWFELYNDGMTAINLSDYFVSDRLENTSNWQLPDATLPAGQRVLVFASGKNRWGTSMVIDHMETPIYPWNWWTYSIPTEQPDASWNDIGFDDSSWATGPGGIGFGDGDDGTDLGGGILSIYSRTTFTLSNTEDVGFMLVNVDYDDAFVCYLNGVEIARANIGTVGVEPSFNTPADAGHEALTYQGVVPESFIIDDDVFNSLLVEGENVIALQVHNADITSSDLTGSLYLLLGMASPTVQTELAPDWINYTPPLNHADFGLSAGETLYVKDNTGHVTDSRIIDQMQSDHSLRRSTDGATSWCFTATPTPATPNVGTCVSAYEPSPVFSVESGVFNAPVYVSISSPNPDALIYLTFDGSIPDQDDLLYTNGFPVSGSVVISARAYGVNSLPSPVEKNTYMISESEIGIPVVSVSTDPANLWDPVTGIHVFGPPDYDPNVPYFGANFWEDWEREAYVEYFDGDHVKQMEGPCGIKIHGGWSRSQEQKSLRIQAKGKYGMESMDYPLIADKPYIESFKGFNLRNGGNAYGDYRFHEALIERTNRNTHVDYMAYTPAIVFLNGEYWGYMEIRENLDQHYIANNHDIGSSDATVVSANYMGFNVINGDPTSFYNLHEFATTNDPNGNGYFEEISTMLDIENYADYIIAQTYWANGDWSNGWQNNTKLWHDDRPGGKWRFMLMDMDFGMGLAGASPTDDYINTAGDEGYLTDQLFGALIQNDEFRSYFINRYADLINTEYQIDR
ncbi:MAG: CotH kinase family protein, partial [Flavobacteriales bacterium]|nr:CotH kinase family protein [Flavobacteriales bacterium]